MDGGGLSRRAGSYSTFHYRFPCRRCKTHLSLYLGRSLSFLASFAKSLRPLSDRRVSGEIVGRG